MMLSKPSKRIVGRRVRIVAWERSERDLEGTITYVDFYANNECDVWVQVDGLRWERAFGMHQLEVRPVGRLSEGFEPASPFRPDCSLFP